ncbi:DUF938 domain-containing protein [Methylocapsa sp. S129]|uniref:DUF938 domain-containing protein n=1 Tax=Methylocapsa sp. S129 TaxID=1641869 RepID=UPI00352ACEAB
MSRCSRRWIADPNGPYKREGFETAPSNQAFDRNLRNRNPAWGLRDLEAVAAIA